MTSGISVYIYLLVYYASIFPLSALGSGPDWLQQQIVRCLSEGLSAAFSSASTDNFSNLMDSITSCLDGFVIGMNGDVFIFD